MRLRKKHSLKQRRTMGQNKPKVLFALKLTCDDSVGVQGAIRLSPVNSPVFCVILSQRTFSTPPLSALKTGEFPRAEVAESKMS